MILDEFLVKLGVISDPKDIDTFVGGLQKVATVAAAVVGVVGTATAAITSFFGAALDGLDDLANLSKDTDTDLTYIQKLGYAAQLSGSSVESANASIKGLSQTIGEAASGLGRGKAAFEAYGLSAKNADGSVKSVGEMLDDVQRKMVKLSKAEQLSMLSKLGIDQSMIGLLNSSSEAMATLFQEAEDLGVVTAAGADAAQEFNDTLDQMNMVMGAIRTNIAVGLAPQLTNIVGRLRDWLIRNKELIREGIDKAVTVILALWRAIMRAVDVVDKIISKTIGWKAALLILGATLIWLNKTMLLAFATNPITLIAAAIAGLILLVDDLVTFMEGGESMFDWSWAVPIIESVSRAINLVKENMRAVAVVATFVGTALLAALPASAWIAAVGSVTSTLIGLTKFLLGPLVSAITFVGKAIAIAFTANPIGLIVAAVAALAVAIYLYWDEIKAYLAAAWAWLVQTFGADIDALVTKFTSAWDSIKSGFSGAMGFITKLWDTVSGSIGSGIDKITGALNWLGESLGITSSSAASAAQTVSQASGMTADAQASAHPSSSQSVVNNSKSATVSSPVSVTQHISTSDPKAAADLSAQAIKREQQRAVTNAGGAYGL